MTATHLPVPDWLQKREGSLKQGIREFIRFVILNGQPQYRLDVRPASGQFTCVVVSNINGKQLDDGKARYPSLEAAFAGGLEQLRTALGW